jgi:circadian clock protein KaiC
LKTPPPGRDNVGHRQVVRELSFLFHNIVLLRYIEIESEARRSISIFKMRGSDHAKGLCDVGEHGLTVGAQLTGVTGVLGWTALRGDRLADVSSS